MANYQDTWYKVLEHSETIMRKLVALLAGNKNNEILVLLTF
jgi:hypothetical protein